MDNQIARIEALEQRISNIITFLKERGFQCPLSPEVIAKQNQCAYEYYMKIFNVCLLSFSIGCAYNYFTWNIKHRLSAILQSTCNTIIVASGFGTLGLGFALFCEKLGIRP